MPEMTEFALRAMDLATLFQGFLGREHVSGYHPELAAPDAPSTGGGKQATQHIKLVRDESSPVIVMGAANQAEMTAELRTFRCLAARHAERYKGAALTLDKQQYEDLLDSIERFFLDRGFLVNRVDVEQKAPAATVPPKIAAAAKQAQRSNTTLIVAVLGAALVVAAATFFLLRSMN